MLMKQTSTLAVFLTCQKNIYIVISIFIMIIFVFLFLKRGIVYTEVVRMKGE